ncbi:MAG: hypothetical protein P4L85_18110 [Paludisphaera borealis]|uniref:hypothetical protein n=1 Tax=Paludisphaera borealis TaxID=1387353 RepID=UPI0028496113|nr:hypothetical protein [Paludisphaera borealis]MDR3621272.1 hypothetical protein [Paludisphaera borealis]
MYQTYKVRSPRIVMEMASEGGAPPQPTSFSMSKALIHLSFDTKGQTNWGPDKNSRLRSASFSSDHTIVVEMPGQR